MEDCMQKYDNGFKLSLPWLVEPYEPYENELNEYNKKLSKKSKQKQIKILKKVNKSKQKNNNYTYKEKFSNREVIRLEKSTIIKSRLFLGYEIHIEKCLYKAYEKSIIIRDSKKFKLVLEQCYISLLERYSNGEVNCFSCKEWFKEDQLLVDKTTTKKDMYLCTTCKERKKSNLSGGTKRRRENTQLNTDGTFTNGSAYKIFISQEKKCNICDCVLEENNFHADHIYPLSKGGKHSIDNMQILCATCNLKKSDSIPTDEEIKKYIKKRNYLTSLTKKDLVAKVFVNKNGNSNPRFVCKIYKDTKITGLMLFYLMKSITNEEELNILTKIITKKDLLPIINILDVPEKTREKFEKSAKTNRALGPIQLENLAYSLKGLNRFYTYTEMSEKKENSPNAEDLNLRYFVIDFLEKQQNHPVILKLIEKHRLPITEKEAQEPEKSFQKIESPNKKYEWLQYISCPHCDGKNINKKDRKLNDNKLTTRYFCQDCNKQFQNTALLTNDEVDKFLLEKEKRLKKQKDNKK